ncbi:hypothetical protein CARUB_v10003504mg, partial [Capsella rubella]
FSSSFSPSDKVTKALLNQIFSQRPIAKHFCIPWLSSDPKTFTLDLNGLLVMVFEKAEIFGYKNLELIKSVDRATTDPTFKNPYESCMRGYQLSNKALHEAKGFASTNMYVLSYKAAFKAFDSIDTCESLLEGLTMPGNIATRNLWYERMCNIGMVFSELLDF